MWVPPDPRPAAEWCEEFVKIPYSSRRRGLDLDLTPYLRDPMNCAQGDKMLHGHRVKETTCVAAVQSAKSTLQEALACWVIAQDAGPLMWNFQADPDAKDAAETRIMKVFKATQPVADLLPGGDKERNMMIIFDAMFLLIQGAHARANLQQKSIRWVFNDETWLWPAGHLEESRKRTTSYWNGMVFNVSTAGIKDDDTDAAFKLGDMREWMFTCPDCGEEQRFKLGNRKEKGGIKWDDDKVTRTADGEWDKIKLVPTVRYECQGENCAKTWEDAEKSRREMNRTGFYRAMNPNPTPGHASFHWNAFCVPWIMWSDMVLEYVNAVETSRTGQMKLLQEFVQKRLAESWEPRGVEEKITVPLSDFNMLDEWELERHRFMTVDVQSDHFWVEVSLWSEEGARRLYWCGKVDTWEDVRNKQLDLKVKDRSVGVDCSYGQGATGPRTVYYQCCKYGWIALAGDDREEFIIKVPGQVAPRRSLISKMETGDPLLGAKKTDNMNPRMMKTRACPRWRWSNPGIKDILENLSRGRGMPFEIPRDTPEIWHEHMRSEVKRKRPNKDTGRPEVCYVLIGKRQNHLRDGACMSIVMAVISKVLGDEVGQQVPHEEDIPEEPTGAFAGLEKVS